MEGSGALAQLPEDIEREIVAAYCGLACLLPEALGRRKAYEKCLAELDYVRHNVQTGDKIRQRTLRERAERAEHRGADEVRNLVHLPELCQAGGGLQCQDESDARRDEQDDADGSDAHSDHLGHERRSPFARESTSSEPPAGPQDHDARENETRDGGRWPRVGGLPDLRDSIQSAISSAVERSDLRNLADIPRKSDLDALNENLNRVADAIERLEAVLRERD